MYGISMEDLGYNVVKVYFLMEIMKIDLRKLIFQERVMLKLEKILFEVKNKYSDRYPLGFGRIT